MQSLYQIHSINTHVLFDIGTINNTYVMVNGSMETYTPTAASAASEKT